jgi:hypothetical protein
MKITNEIDETMITVITERCIPFVFGLPDSQKSDQYELAL